MIETISAMTTRGWVILAILNIPWYLLTAKILFNDLSGFGEALRFWFTPNIFSMFRGEYVDDIFAEMKLLFWLVISAGAVIYEAGWLIDHNYFTSLYVIIKPVSEAL